jgi:hypothetical protein
MQMDMLKIYFLLLLACLPFFPCAQNNNDGPYVFYNGTSVNVKSIYNGQTEIISFPESEKSKHELPVHISGHPDWDFTVTLKSELHTDSSVFAETEKIIAFSDIEGEFEPFRKMLLANHVIDTSYEWIFGKGALVIAGDLFDRGKNVAAYIWLLYKLEDEARDKGGAVQVILGNHDIMNMSGDFRYVNSVYFKNARLLKERYANLYNKNTELGRWLRSKNVLVKIGDLLVLHGGVSPAVNAKQWTIFNINSYARTWYGFPNDDIPDSLITLFDDNAPFWYRGYFIEPRATNETIDSTCGLFKCTQILVGHTILARNPALYYNGKIIGIDVDEHRDSYSGVLFNEGNIYRIDESGEQIPLKYNRENDIIRPE